MTWRYDQSTGDLFHDDEFVGTGYSGAGRTLAEGRNNPEMEAAKERGPIPAGEWQIGSAHNSDHTGPLSITLTPVGHNAFGRSGFLMHGNNKADNASHGCIIMARGIREQVLASGDHRLEVVH